MARAASGYAVGMSTVPTASASTSPARATAAVIPTEALPVAHVVFTTHWDREWIQTFEQYRFRLVELIDRLMAVLEAEPGLRFVFDGQTVVIEDYLAVRPDQRERLRDHARAGRIVFGPWYVLADQFLECEEATVRNLHIGMRIAADFGGAMMHGYVPDSFGSIATLPAIMAGFGIRSVNFGRGPANMADGAKAVYRWRWLDGSEVLALVRGYGNGMWITRGDLGRDLDESLSTAESAVAAARPAIDGECPANPAGPLYFSAGCDHMEMRPGMTAILAALNQAGLGVRFVASDPGSFASDAERAAAARGVVFESISGEMRGMPTWPMDLQGVLSTNREIKRLNRECELILTRALEPLELVHHARTGRSNAHFLEHAWKLLVQNHPHDSICACSRDEVMADIAARFQHILQLHAVMAERLLRELLPRRTDVIGPAAVARSHGGSPIPAFTLFNPVLRRGRAPFTARVRIPTRLAGEEWDVLDGDDRVVGSGRLAGLRNIDLETWYATNHDLGVLACKAPSPARDPAQVYTLVDVEGVADFGDHAGFQTFRLEPARAGSAAAPTVVAIAAAVRAPTPRSIANGVLELEVGPGGGLTLRDTRDWSSWSGLCWFEDCADRGDTYDFQPLQGDVPLSTRATVPVEITATVIDERTARLVVVSELAIPERSGAEGRSARALAHRIVATYTLRAGVARVEARVAWENRAVHHRLRVGFSCDDVAGDDVQRPEIRSGGHFAALPRAWTRAGERFPCRPMTDYLHLARPGAGGLALMTRGLYEFEARARTTGGDVLITLIRAVDMVGPAAGCNLPVTHARELGAQAAEFAFAPSATLASTIHQASAYVSPLFGEGCLVGTGLDELASLPRELLWCDDTEIAVTCLKRAADGTGTIVRFFNPGAMARHVRLRLGLPWTTVAAVDLAENPVAAPIASRDAAETLATATVELAAHAIVTLRFRA